MAQTFRLNKVLKELNVSIDRVVDFLESKGMSIDKSPNTKISAEVYNILSSEFQTDASKKLASKEVSEAKQKEKEDLKLQREKELAEKAKAEEESRKVLKAKASLSGPKVVNKIDLNPSDEVVNDKDDSKVESPVVADIKTKSETKDNKTEDKIVEEVKEETTKSNSSNVANDDNEVLKANKVQFKGPKVLDKIDPEMLSRSSRKGLRKIMQQKKKEVKPEPKLTSEKQAAPSKPVQEKKVQVVETPQAKKELTLMQEN